MPVAAPARPTPKALARLSLIACEKVPSEQLARIATGLHGIARPPHALYELLSLDFIANAGSVELGELIMGETLVAAKVLAKVNSPLYGIQRPVTHLGQAITFMGMSAVRSVCLAYLLDKSFEDDSPQLRKAFDRIRKSSSLASELCTRLSQRLHLPDPGSLATQVLLSFTGHFAAVVLQYKADGTVDNRLQPTLLERVRSQQEGLGIAAPEIGRLLMREWTLPEQLIDEVAALDRVIVTRLAWSRAEQPARLALGYLCARLGERFSGEGPQELADIDEMLDSDADFHHLLGYLELPALSGLREALRSPELWVGLRT